MISRSKSKVRLKYSQDREFLSSFLKPTEEWSDPKYKVVENRDCFSDHFIEFLQELMEITRQYVNSPYDFHVSQNSTHNNHFEKIGKFCLELFHEENTLRAFFKTFGYKGKYGLELATGNARLLQRNINRIPTARDLKEYYGGILTAINEGYWKKFGIKPGSYNDFLRFTFGHNLQKANRYYKGEQGLENAKVEMLRMQERWGKIPTYRDVADEYGGIINAINEGYWEDFGITKGRFNDLLDFVFDEINQFQKPKGMYKGKAGFDRASTDVRELEEELGKLPTKKDVEKNYRGINYAIDHGFWVPFNIRRGHFNDFLMKIFGRVNKRRNGYYKGEDGLDRAKFEAVNLAIKLDKIPSYRDIYSNLGGIITAIREGYWKRYGIMKFVDFKMMIRSKLDEVDLN